MNLLPPLLLRSWLDLRQSLRLIEDHTRYPPPCRGADAAASQYVRYFSCHQSIRKPASVCVTTYALLPVPMPRAVSARHVDGRGPLEKDEAEHPFVPKQGSPDLLASVPPCYW